MRGYGTILLNPTGFSSNGVVVTAGQPILFPDGSQTAPSISFSSDSDTGFFWSSSGEFRATNNGTGVIGFKTSSLTPVTDNAYDIGDSSHRLSTVHARSITYGQSLANPFVGAVTLSGGTGTASVQTSALTAGARIFLSHNSAKGTTGTARVTSSTNGVGFTIVSSSSTDTSDIAWLIVPVT